MPRLSFLALALLALGFFPSCSGGREPETFEFRILHASPDAPVVDLYFSGRTSPIVVGLGFGQSTGILDDMGSGLRIEVRPSGAAPTSTPVFVSDPVNFAGGARYSVIATGLFGTPGSFRILVNRDDLTAPAAGNYRARVVHAAPNAPTVALDVFDDGTPDLTGLERYAATPTAGFDIPAGAPLAVGILDDATLTRVTSFTLPALPAGSEVIVVATGLLGRRPDDVDGFALRAAVDTGSFATIRQDPLLYVVHASPDAPAVDLFEGGNPIVTGLSFGQLRGPVQVRPGNYAVQVRPAGQATVVATINTPTVQAGDTWLVTATGFLNPDMNEAPFQPLFLEENLAEDAANTRLLVVHASPDAPAVDVSPIGTPGLLVQPPLVSNLSFPNPTVPNLGLPVGPIAPLTLGVAAAGSPNAIASFTTATAADLRLIVLAAGALTPRVGVDQGFQLLVIDTTSAPWSIATLLPNP